MEKVYLRAGGRGIGKGVEKEEGLIANSQAGRGKREQLRQDALAAWAGYRTTGLHVTSGEADAWLAKLEAGQRAVIPKCHGREAGY